MTPAPRAAADLADLPMMLRLSIRALIDAERKAAYDTGFKAGYQAGDRDAVKRMMRVVSPDSQSIAAIKRAVSAASGVSIAEMSSSRRRAAPVRQVAMYLCRELTPLSLPAIGRHFGGRDHTTIMHGIRRVAEKMAADPAFAAEIDLLRAAARPAA